MFVDANAHVKDMYLNKATTKKAAEELINQCLTTGFETDKIKDRFAYLEEDSEVEETVDMMSIVLELAKSKSVEDKAISKVWTLFQRFFIDANEYDFEVDGEIYSPMCLLINADFTVLPKRIKAVPTQFITYPSNEADGACVACPSSIYSPEKVKDFYGYKIAGEDLKLVHSVWRVYNQPCNEPVADFYDKDSAIKYAESEKENGLTSYTIAEIFR